MKKLFFLLTFIYSFSLNAQEWQTIEETYFGCSCGITTSPDYSSKTFKINPYTNDLWMVNNTALMTISNIGVPDIFTHDSMNIPQSAYGFLDFCFTPNAVYVSKFWNGFYQFKNNIWTQILGNNYQSSSIASDGDTIIITGVSENYLKYYEQSNQLTEFNYSNVRKSANRNGEFWGSDGTAFATRIVGNVGITYNPDTCSLLSYWAFDLKFARKTDSIYVAGDLGLSIAYQNTFIDSIDVNSSINMPSQPSIMEFEFDHLNNIWALFGTDTDELIGIGYYNQTNRTWEQFYDGSNSPVDFTQKLTIEVDTSGNLWVAERRRLHVLKINNAPQWLNTIELKKDFDFSIYPNPGSGEFTVQLPSNLGDYAIAVTDLKGTELLRVNNPHIVSHDLPSGIYFLSVSATDGSSAVRKFIVK